MRSAVRTRVRFPVVLLAAGTVAVALVLVIGNSVWAELADGTPCPSLPRHTAPSAIHLVPGIFPHASWIDVAVTPGDVNVYVLCRDGLFQALAYRPLTESYVRFGVSTIWVDAQWLRGQLDTFYATEHWDVMPLTCVSTGKDYAACS